MLKPSSNNIDFCIMITKEWSFVFLIRIIDDNADYALMLTLMMFRSLMIMLTLMMLG